MIPGPRNLITDIAGLKVGNAQDSHIKTGVTVLTADKPFLVSVDVMGGSPGTRETDLLAPDKLVEDIDALVLSGGSAFGLDAATGVVDALRRQGRGFRVGQATIPIVPAAIVFDLLNGGDKVWDKNPYPALGAAALAAAGEDFALGTAGGGTGALTANLKGGLGSASLVLPSGHMVGALVIANPTGSVTMGDAPNFWAAPFEADNEFGGLGVRLGAMSFEQTTRTKRDPSGPMANTTIAIVATDAILTKAQAKRLAVAAQDGIARGACPAHSPVDGDLIFAVSTRDKVLDDPLGDMLHLGHGAAVCLSRAMARAIYLAAPAPGDTVPTWRQRWGTEGERTG
ncbi:P1 family peptidase [Devosia sp.]|uniref:P1 family peptidase n=1 Tax=Devosia sp. TaxID=1871048 RepID=UPI001AC7860B|nr:P1 family peptidase [Devosia sp.]MBN9333742.1 P1 family peptidase [Devosia sp.]